MPFTKTTAGELRCGAFVSCAYLYHSSNTSQIAEHHMQTMHSLLLYYLSEATTLTYTRLCPLMEPAFWEKENYRKLRSQMRAREGPREHVCVIRNISEEEVKGSRKWFEAEMCADLRRRHSNLQWSQKEMSKKKKSKSHSCATMLAVPFTVYGHWFQRCCYQLLLFRVRTQTPCSKFGRFIQNSRWNKGARFPPRIGCERGIESVQGTHQSTSGHHTSIPI